MSYQFEHSWKHERERLASIEGGLDGSTIACLTTIGVGPGWRCLEVGAGAGSIAHWLCVEDADLVSLKHASTPDRSFFTRGYEAFLGAMVANGYHADLGLHLGDALRRLKLRDVQVRGWVGEWTGASPFPSVYLRTFEKMRDKVLDSGDLSAAEADRFLAAIQSPEFRAITAVYFAAWGQLHAELAADRGHK